MLSRSRRETTTMQQADSLGSDVYEEVDGARGLGDGLDVGVVRERGGGSRHVVRCLSSVV